MQTYSLDIYATYIHFFDRIYRPWLPLISRRQTFKDRWTEVLKHGSLIKRTTRVVFYTLFLTLTLANMIWAVLRLNYDFLPNFVWLLQEMVILSSFYFRVKLGYSFLRSVVYTITTTLVGTIVFALLDADNHMNAVIISPNTSILNALIQKMFFLSLPFKISVDYLSIIKMRWILESSRFKKVGTTFIYLLSDLIASITIFIILSFHVWLPGYTLGLNKLSLSLFGKDAVLIGNVFTLFLVPFLTTFFIAIPLYYYIIKFILCAKNRNTSIG